MAFLLTELANRARIASITASSALEGVVVDDQARAAAIIGGKVTTLRTRSEQELAGYRAALDYLVDRCNEAITEGRHHPVLLVGLFVLDLLIDVRVGLDDLLQRIARKQAHCRGRERAGGV